MNKIKNANKHIILIYYFNILLLSLYSCYKNGILLYHKNLIGFIGIFKPLFIIFLAILITYLIDYIFLRYLKKDNNYLTILKNDYNPLYFAILAATLPININIFLYFILLIILNIFNNLIKQDKFNYVSLYKLCIIILLLLFNKYNYLNTYETSVETSLTTFDMVLGRSFGGLGTTNILLLIMTFFIFNIIPCYKKEIPVTAFLAYFLMLIISTLFKFNFILNMKELINSEFIFGIIFVATIPEYSPVTEKSKIIFGLLIGILSFIFNKLINPYEGVFVAILVINLIYYCQIKFKKLYYLRQKRNVL